MDREATERDAGDILHSGIKKLAYQFWEDRGRATGSPEEDWFRAERELRHHFGQYFDSPAALPFSSILMGPT
jgi:hypothetical protein